MKVMIRPSNYLTAITEPKLTLCQEIISSLMMALRRALTLKEGVARQRAVATMDAVKGPDTPMLVTSSARLGVNRNGTGRFPSNSPKDVKRIQNFLYTCTNV